METHFRGHIRAEFELATGVTHLPQGTESKQIGLGICMPMARYDTAMAMYTRGRSTDPKSMDWASTVTLVETSIEATGGMIASKEKANTGRKTESVIRGIGTRDSLSPKTQLKVFIDSVCLPPPKRSISLRPKLRRDQIIFPLADHHDKFTSILKL